MTTIYGTDMSHYDAAPANLGARLAAEGFSFATHKAGGDASDAEIGSWWNAVKGQRGSMLLGAYWVLRPDLGISASGSAQAFLARLDSQCPGWRDGPFILQLDCEIWNGNKATAPSKTWVQVFADTLHVKMPKLRPIVYASKGQYGNSLSGLGYPLWNANYPSGMTGAASAIYARVDGDTGPGWTTYSGQMPAIWQFTSSATIAGQTTCDANAYRGTLAELTALLAPGWKTEETDLNLTDKVGSEAYPGRTVEDFFSDWWGMRDPLVVGASKTPALPPASPLAKLIATPGKVDALTTQLADLSAKVDALAAAVNTGQGGFTQAQLDAAVLNAMKSGFGGQA